MRIGFLMEYSKERIEFAKKVGFKSCELKVTGKEDFFPGKDGWETKAEEMKSVYEENGIRISCIGGFYVNHFDPQKEEEYKKLVRNVILLAERINVKVVAGFAGRIVGRPLEESIPKFKEIWGEHVKFAEDHGVKIAFENCLEPWFGGSPADLLWFISNVDSDYIGICLDTGHIHANHLDVGQAIRQVGDHLIATHIHDNNGRHDQHYPPLMGTIDWRKVMKAFREINYKYPLIFEVRGNMEKGKKINQIRLLEKIASYLLTI